MFETNQDNAQVSHRDDNDDEEEEEEEYCRISVGRIVAVHPSFHA